MSEWISEVKVFEILVVVFVVFVGVFGFGKLMFVGWCFVLI